MGRKKKPQISDSHRASVQPFRPFCYYCEKEYPEEAKLINHQRAVHFKCPLCVRRFDNIRGLLTHASAVHGENLDAVPQALKERRSVDTEIVGMRGIPSEVIVAKAVGTDLERFILDGQIHLHPVFAGKL